MSSDEHVLGVSADLLEQIGPFSGFQRDVQAYLPSILDRRHQSFQPRSRCETDPGFKQLIPYIILEYRDPSGIHLFQYTRGKGAGEKRLHAKRSIGIGGHISTDDTHGDDWYRTGMARELDEEIVLGKTLDPSNDEIVGLIFDDTTDVGRVHLGVVHLMRLSQPDVRSREDDLTDAGFLPLETIRAEADRLETWSRLCLDHIYSVPSE